MFQRCRRRVTFLLVILGLAGTSNSTLDGGVTTIIKEAPYSIALRRLLALSQSDESDVDFIDPPPAGSPNRPSPVDPDPVTLSTKAPPPKPPSSKPPVRVKKPLSTKKDKTPRVSLLDIIRSEASGKSPQPEEATDTLSEVELTTSDFALRFPPGQRGGGNVQGGLPPGVRTGPIFAPPPGQNGSLPSGVGTLPGAGSLPGGGNIGSLPGPGVGGPGGSGLRIGPPAEPANVTAPPLTQPEEGKLADFFGENPPDRCTCTDAVPSGAFNCMQVRFQEQCKLDSIMDSPPDVPEGFCQITCGRCDCCTDLLTMASRRGLDTFRKTLQIMAEAEGSRSIARSLQNPSFSSTVFAPTNDAFGRMLKVLKMTQEEFFEQPSLLNQIVTYHVLLGPTAATSEELSSGFLGTTLPTVNAAAFITINATEPVMQLDSIGSTANVLIPDIYACKAIFHVIDEVLLPFSTEGL